MSQPKTISKEVLLALTGMELSELGSLADAGFFKKPKKGEYLMAETLSGIFKFYRQKKGKVSPNLSGTIQAWANALGKDPDTIKSKLTKANIKYDPLLPLTALEIFDALIGKNQIF